MQECGPMPALSALRFSARFAAAIATLCFLLAACGGAEKKEEPRPEDVDAVAAAMSDLVYQCGSYTAGHIAEPDREALERDVETLLDASDRLEADSSLEIGKGTAVARSTTLREELRLGARVLGDGCVPELGDRLTEAADD
jgi:hypothetical protein